MSTLTTTYTFVADTVIRPSEMNQNFTDVRTWGNGNIDNTNIASSAGIELSKLEGNIAAAGGFNTTGSVRRGKSIVATEESRSNTAYGTLTTADQVQNVVLPTDGLIFALYQARWGQSAAGAARAALFIGSNQLKTLSGVTLGAQQARVDSTGTINRFYSLATCPLGLVSSPDAGSHSPAPVTTGQTVAHYHDGGAGDEIFEVDGTGHMLDKGGFGEPCAIFAAAGTYTVSVQFKASSAPSRSRNGSSGSGRWDSERPTQ